MKNKPAVKLWRQTDTSFVLRVALIGLVGGISIRWLDKVTPPLPVQAVEFHATSTNAPTVIRIEGASPSARD